MSDDIVKRLREEPWVAATHYEAAEEIERLRAELAACKEQLHLTNIDWFQAEAERDALLALLRSAVMQLPEHRRARFEDALKGDGDE
jgi:hypothetical protein